MVTLPSPSFNTNITYTPASYLHTNRHKNNHKKTRSGRNTQAIKQVSDMTRPSSNKCGLLSTKATHFFRARARVCVCVHRLDVKDVQNQVTRLIKMVTKWDTGNTRQGGAALLHLSHCMERSASVDSVFGFMLHGMHSCTVWLTTILLCLLPRLRI